MDKDKQDTEKAPETVPVAAVPPELFNRVVNILMDHTTPRISFAVLKDLERQVKTIQVEQ